jgi:hypothetical protein
VKTGRKRRQADISMKKMEVQSVKRRKKNVKGNTIRNQTIKKELEPEKLLKY